MQIDWLTTFLAVIDHGGFHAASEATYRSQSRVSAHVASLEREVGATLFDRSARPVKLTDAGVVFAEHARRTVAALGEGRTAIQALRGLVNGEVTLGTYPSAGALLVPRLLMEYRDAHPGVWVQLHETDTVQLDELLDKGPADVALRPTHPTPARELAHQPLWRERMVVLVRPDSPMSVGPNHLQVTDLADQDLILTGRVFQHDSEPYMLLADRGLSPRVACVTNQPQTLVNMVREGLGTAVTNELALRMCEHSEVVVKHFADPGMHRDVGVYWRDGVTWSSAAAALLRLLQITAMPEGTEDIRT